MPQPDPVGPAGSGILDTGNLYFPGLSQLIIEQALPSVIAPQVFTRLPALGYQTMSIPKEVTPRTGSQPIASGVGPGDFLPLDVLGFESQLIKAVKYARGHLVTNEELRYQQFPATQAKLRRQGFVMGNTANAIAMKRIREGRLAANDVDAVAAGGGGRTLGLNGTEFDRAGSIGQYAILDAKKKIMEANLEPDTIMVNAQGLTDISRLPQYSAQLLYGVPAYQNAERGFVEGLRILAGQIVQGPAGELGSAYVLATGATAVSLGQYMPMGYMMETLPIMSTVRQAPERDSYEVYSITEFEAAVVKGATIAQINYSAT